MLRLILFILLWAIPAFAYLTDKNVHTEPTAPILAAAGATATDPIYGSTIMRLTDGGDAAAPGCKVVYSNSPALNVNNTKVAAICASSNVKIWDFNPTTMTRSNGRVQSNDIANFQDYGMQWSRTTYNKFYACARGVLYEKTIPDGTSTTWTNTIVHDFTTLIGAQASASNDYCTQVSISSNDDIFGMHYILNDGTADESSGYLAYKRSTNTVLLHVVGGVNEVEIDKSGRYLVKCCGPVLVWDLQATPSPTSTTVTNQPWNHRALGNGISVDGGTGGGSLFKRNLSTPNTVTTLLTGWSYSNGRQDHFSITGSDARMMSCRYFQNYTTVSAPYDQECLEINTNGDTGVRRHVHNRARVYTAQNGDLADDAQPHGNVSMDGQFIAWTSNWDGANVSARNDVYIARITPVVDTTPPAAPTGLTVQ
jgi:hypothetical protein